MLGSLLHPSLWMSLIGCGSQFTVTEARAFKRRYLVVSLISPVTTSLASLDTSVSPPLKEEAVT